METTGTLANTVGGYNPFRYKGYYYDVTYKMYYCQSRYYLPSWGRWLNADSPVFLQPIDTKYLNLFIYCCNNPIMFVDGSGTLPKWAQWLILGIATIAAVALVICGTILTAGAASPGLMMAATMVTAKTAGAILVGAGTGFLIGAGINLIEQSEQYNGNLSNIEPIEAVYDGFKSAVISAVCTTAAIAFSSIGANIGAQWGYNLSQHIINGRKLASIFGGRKLFVNVGQFLGKAIGTIAGVGLYNELGGLMINSPAGFVADIKKGFSTWIKDIIKYLIELF